MCCLAFEGTLFGAAKLWFRNLQPGSIHNFEQLSSSFIANFYSNTLISNDCRILLSVRQEDDESLEAYFKRFNEEKAKVRNTEASVVMAALQVGIKHEKLRESLVDNPPKNLQEMYNRIQGRIRADQDLKALKGEKTKTKKKDTDKEKTKDQSEKDKQGKDKKRDFSRYTFHTPTTAPPTQVMAVMHQRQILPPAPKLSTKSYRRNTGLWCHDHWFYGNDTIARCCADMI